MGQGESVTKIGKSDVLSVFYPQCEHGGPLSIILSYLDIEEIQNRMVLLNKVFYNLCMKEKINPFYSKKKLSDYEVKLIKSNLKSLRVKMCRKFLVNFENLKPFDFLKREVSLNQKERSWRITIPECSYVFEDINGYIEDLIIDYKVDILEIDCQDHEGIWVRAIELTKEERVETLGDLKEVLNDVRAYHVEKLEKGNSKWYKEVVKQDEFVHKEDDSYMIFLLKKCHYWFSREYEKLDKLFKNSNLDEISKTIEERRKKERGKKERKDV